MGINAGKKTRIPVKAAKVPKMRQIEYIYEYMETSYTEVIFSSQKVAQLKYTWILLKSSSR